MKQRKTKDAGNKEVTWESRKTKGWYQTHLHIIRIIRTERLRIRYPATVGRLLAGSATLGAGAGVSCSSAVEDSLVKGEKSLFGSGREGEDRRPRGEEEQCEKGYFWVRGKWQHFCAEDGFLGDYSEVERGVCDSRDGVIVGNALSTMLSWYANRMHCLGEDVG